LSAVLCRCAGAALLGISLTFAPITAAAQPASSPTVGTGRSRAADTVKFLAGGVAAFAFHEGGHLLLDGLFDANPRITRVNFGPIPFFAIDHGRLPPRRDFSVSSIGLWVQDATNEWLLSTRQNLRDEHAPFVKGVVAFNVLTSFGYGAIAIGRVGPFERDTRGIADSSRVDERAVGALVMAPAVLDGYRYFRPESKWAAWASRIVKAGSAVLIIRAR
jgi:hypothetical protein